jgi:hypothetical protein
VEVQAGQPSHRLVIEALRIDQPVDQKLCQVWWQTLQGLWRLRVQGLAQGIESHVEQRPLGCRSGEFAAGAAPPE